MNRPLAVLAFAVAFALPAHADNEPLIWPDGTITYRDWGLYRGGVPVLIERPYYGYGYEYSAPVTKGDAVPYFPMSNGEQNTYPVNPDFYPSNHRDPNAYRMRPRIRPVPPQPYSRSWGVGSDPAPAPADSGTQSAVPVEPNVIYAPDDHHRRARDSGHHKQ